MDNILKNKRIILGITGSISAYKSPLIVREFVKKGAHVNCIMTPTANHFVAKDVLSNLTMAPVRVEMFDSTNQEEGAWHIQLAHWANLMLIAPCSATTMSRIANGLCDTALATVSVALPRETPLVIAPAMDETMWMHPATQRNVEILKSFGAHIIEPESGELSSGLSGKGRLPDPEKIVNQIAAIFSGKVEVKNENTKENKKEDDNTVEIVFEKKEKSAEEKIQEAVNKPFESVEESVEKDKFNAELELEKLKNKNNYKRLKGKKVVISAGPTLEKIDDVRYISNHSSGKMGYYLADQAQKMGADVYLISGPVNLNKPDNVHIINVKTAQEMFDAVTKEFVDSDIAIMSAAVADYSPSESKDGKIKKHDVGEEMTIKLKSTKDILATLGERKTEQQMLVGFALESTNEIENGWKKLKKKNCDMVVVNSANKPGSGFGGDDNTINLLMRDGDQESFPRMSKQACSYLILNKVIKFMEIKGIL